MQDRRRSPNRRLPSGVPILVILREVAGSASAHSLAVDSATPRGMTNYPRHFERSEKSAFPLSEVRHSKLNSNNWAMYYFAVFASFALSRFPFPVMSSTLPCHFESPSPSFRAQREICFPLSAVIHSKLNSNSWAMYYFAVFASFALSRFPFPVMSSTLPCHFESPSPSFRAQREICFPLSAVIHSKLNSNSWAMYYFAVFASFALSRFPFPVMSSTLPCHFESPSPSFRAQREICFPLSAVIRSKLNSNNWAMYYFAVFASFALSRFPFPVMSSTLPCHFESPSPSFRAQREICFPLSAVIHSKLNSNSWAMYYFAVFASFALSRFFLRPPPQFDPPTMRWV